jgi:hypothetical protein
MTQLRSLIALQPLSNYCHSLTGETVTSAWLPRRRLGEDRGSGIEHLAVLYRVDSLHVLIRLVTNMIIGLGRRR